MRVVGVLGGRTESTCVWHRNERRRRRRMVFIDLYIEM